MPKNHDERLDREILESLRHLRHEIHELKHIMATYAEALAAFAANQNTFNDRMDAAITDLQGDVKNLNEQIAALQNTPGQITPADQSLLDNIQGRAQAIVDKLDALDALTPPVVPINPVPNPTVRK